MKVVLLCSLNDCDQRVDRDPADGVRTMDAMDTEVRYCPNHERMIDEKIKRINELLVAIANARSRLGTLTEGLGKGTFNEVSDLTLDPYESSILEAIKALIAAFEAESP
ncbi:MAG: hypothetical protein WCV69_04345 [Patescibacteria group bacterium]|jgi:hypothetical protein